MNDLEQQLRKVAHGRKAEEEGAALRYQENSRRRLLKILEKKLTTSFIGALSKFETYFGHLWGHRKDESELTTEERRWREIWTLARTEVLNNGNNQLRAVQSELVQYDIIWNRYQLHLGVSDKQP